MFSIDSARSICDRGASSLMALRTAEKADRGVPNVERFRSPAPREFLAPQGGHCGSPRSRVRRARPDRRGLDRQADRQVGSTRGARSGAQDGPTSRHRRRVRGRSHAGGLGSHGIPRRWPYEQQKRPPSPRCRGSRASGCRAPGGKPAAANSRPHSQRPGATGPQPPAVPPQATSETKIEAEGKGKGKSVTALD
jgi:hypothetical protein